MTDPVDELVRAWSAAEQAGDTSSLEGLLTEDFRAVGPLGFVLSKEDWLARHAAGDLSYEAFGFDEIERTDHDRVSVLTARHTATGIYRDHPVPGALRATVVAADDARVWRIVAVHMSFIAGTEGAPPIPGQAPTREGAPG